MAEELIAEISPGCVRIIVEIGGRTGTGDFMVDVLPQWMESLETSSGEAMGHGTDEGTALACEIAFDAVRLEEWDLACIAALKETSRRDLQKDSDTTGSNPVTDPNLPATAINEVR